MTEHVPSTAANPGTLVAIPTGMPAELVRETAALTVPHLDARIVAAITAPGCALDMSDWHSCETTHCRAGWAVHLAGPEGYALEERLGPSAAGALIYAASRPGRPVPNFHASNEDALADLLACAAADPLPPSTD